VRFPSADHYLGLFHLYRGELAPAAARMAAAIRACDGRYYELYANLGAVLFRMKRWSDAKRCYELVLAEHASNALARERLNEINRAQLPR
jgi:tetratricopeptide (TPR) repeat protein